MKSVAVVLTFLAPAIALADGPRIQPTAFESFVADPAVIVELEQWIGTLDSRDAKLSVTALIAHDGAEPTRRMRGLRLSFEDNGGSDSVHVADSGLAALKRDLADVEEGRTHVKSEPGVAPWRVAGTASCWMPEAPVRILCPSYRIGPEGSGLLLAAQGGRAFEFPDREPAELVALIDRAEAALAAVR